MNRNPSRRATYAAVNGMLADLKRRANAQHAEWVRRAMAQAPSPPTSTFSSDPRVVRAMLARAPSTPRAAQQRVNNKRAKLAAARQHWQRALARQRAQQRVWTQGLVRPR